MKRLKICFINPKPKNFVYDYPPLGFGYLAAYLRKYGIRDYDFKLVDENVGDDVLKQLEEFNPDIIGITSSTPQIKRAGEIAKLIKNTPLLRRKLVIAGGVHPTIMPKAVLKEYKFDMACFGEGEETFREFIDSYIAYNREIPFKKMKEIRGLAFKNMGKTYINDLRDFIPVLDDIPHWDDELYNKNFYFLLPRPVIIGQSRRVGSIITSRGCPYNCVFCSNRTMWRGRVRFHSAAYVLEEINRLVEKYNVGTIILQDDLFMTDKRRVEEICKLLLRTGLSKKIIWGCQGRANLVQTEKDIKLLKLMKRAGCVQIAFGFESGSERILNFLKGGTVTVAQNQRALDITKKAGLRIMGYFMLGTQGEKEEDLLATKEFIVKNQDKLDHYQMYITTPFPGTQIWDLCKKEHLVDGVDWEQYGVGILDRHVFVNTVLPEKVDQLYDELTYLTIDKTSLREKIKWALSNLRTNPGFAVKRISFYLGKRFTSWKENLQ